jgi:hypothetical protein
VVYRVPQKIENQRNERFISFKTRAKASLGIDHRTAVTRSWISAAIGRRQSKIPKEALADSFKKLYERCQQCVVKDGDYFESQ